MNSIFFSVPPALELQRWSENLPSLNALRATNHLHCPVEKNFISGQYSDICHLWITSFNWDGFLRTSRLSSTEADQ